MPCTQLRLAEGCPKSEIDAHDLACRFHFRAKDRVNTGKPVKRKDRLFHGYMFYLYFALDTEVF